MPQISVTLNGRAYRLECSDGEEAHLIELAELLGTHVEEMRNQHGQVGDDRLMLMASLVLADELWELRREMDILRTALAEAHRDRSVADQSAKMEQAELSARVAAAAERLERLNAHVVQTADAANRR